MISYHVAPRASSSRSLRARLALSAATLGLALSVGPGCHIRSYNSPPRIVGTGIIRGHAALGFRENPDVLRANVSLDFDQLVEITIWKLFRLEVGVAGASVGIGPLDLGLGVLFYDPDVPPMVGQYDGPDDGQDEEHDHDHGHADPDASMPEGDSLEDGSSFGGHDHSGEKNAGDSGSADMVPVN